MTDDIEEDWSHVWLVASPSRMVKIEAWLNEYTRYTVIQNSLYKRGYFDWIWELFGYNQFAHGIIVNGGTEAEWKEIQHIIDSF